MNSRFHSFGSIPSLTRGDTWVTNLATLGSLAALPAFTASDLLLACLLQAGITGIFQMPAILLAKHIGHGKLLRGALWFRILLALLLVGSSGLFRSLVFLWIPLDAVSAAAMSVTFSSLSGPRLKTDISIEQALPQLTLPFILGIFSFLITYLVLPASTPMESRLALIPGGVILFMRGLLVWRLKDPPPAPQESLTSREWWLQALSTSLGLFSSLFLIGQLFRAYARFPSAPSFGPWDGIVFAAGLHTLRTLVDLRALPVLGTLSHRRGMIACAVALLVTSLGSLGVFSSTNPSYELQFFTLLLATLITGAASEGIRELMESMKERIAPREKQNAWPGSARSAGSLAFGLIAGFIYFENLEGAALPLFFGNFAVTSIAILFLVFLKHQDQAPSIRSAITGTFTRVTLGLFLSVFCSEALYSVIKSMNESRFREEKTISRFVRDLQRIEGAGNPEIEHFLHTQFSSANGILCGKLILPDHTFNTCPSPGDEGLRDGSLVRPLAFKTGGVLEIQFDHSRVWRTVMKRISAIFILLFFVGALALYFSRQVSRRIRDQLDIILNSVNGGPTRDREALIYGDLRTFKESLDCLLEIKKDHEQQVSIRKISKQIEHDIRSPLLVLRMMIPSLSGISDEEKRALISSVERIGGISKDLERIHSPTLTFGNDRPWTPMVKIRSALEDLVLEKSREFHDRNPIRLDFDPALGDPTLHAHWTSLSRVISNLLNNSIEASQPNSEIRITLSLSRDDSLILTVRDHGSGIDQEDLPKLGTYGFTRNKRNGMGVGLHSAREFLASLGAKLEINSAPGLGTLISIHFPRECLATSALV